MPRPQRSSGAPEKVFRLANISASVFANDVEADGGLRTIRNVNVQRSYQEGDSKKYASTFGVGDLPRVIRVLQLAQQYVEKHEAEVS